MKKIRQSLLVLMLTPAFVYAGPVKEQVPFLGTKTLYFPQQDSSTYEKPPENCQPAFVSMLARHGSRSIVSARSFKYALEKFQSAHKERMLSEKGEDVYEWLENMMNFPEFGLLSKQGEREHIGIGQRMSMAFPDLFTDAQVLLTSTYVTRTKQSRDAFKEGFKEAASAQNHFTIVEGKQCEDFELRFFDSCKRFRQFSQNEARELKSVHSHEFLQSQVIEDLVDESLGSLFHEEYLATLSSRKKSRIVQNLYGLCQHDYDMNPSRGEEKFCSLVHQDLREIMQFAKEDLHSFYKMGPVQQSDDPLSQGINFKMACPALNSFLADMDAVDQGTNAFQAHLRFGHIESVLPVAVLMGLFQTDEDLGSQPNPQWQSSKIAGMASNVQWSAYKCQENGTENLKIRMLYNEKEQHFPIASCQDSFFCDWSSVKEFYEQRYHDLNLGSCSVSEWHEMCASGGRVQSKCVLSHEEL